MQLFKDHRSTYTAHDLTELCRIGEITPPDMAEFKERLEAFSGVYYWHNEGIQNRIKIKEVSAELRKAYKQAERLKSTLESFSQHSLKAIEMAAITDSTKAIMTDETAPKHPSLFLSLKGISENTLGVALDTNDITAILQGLANAAKEGRKDLPKPHPLLHPHHRPQPRPLAHPRTLATIRNRDRQRSFAELRERPALRRDPRQPRRQNARTRRPTVRPVHHPRGGFQCIR